MSTIYTPEIAHRGQSSAVAGIKRGVSIEDQQEVEHVNRVNVTRPHARAGPDWTAPLSPRLRVWIHPPASY